MSVKKASELAAERLNPEQDKEQIKRTTGDLANELDLFSEIDPSAKPAAKPAAKSDTPKPQSEKKAVDLSAAVSSAVASAVSESSNIDPAEVLEGVDDIIEPMSVTENIIHYTAGDKKRLLRELGAEVEFELPQEGKETIVKSGPKRFMPGEEPVAGEKKPEEKKPAVKYKRRKKVLDIDEKKSLVSTIIGIVVVVILCYLGLGFYVQTTNSSAFDDIIAVIDPANLSQTLDIKVPDPSVSAAEKDSYKLSVFLVDSDSDGLSDSFELDRGYAPALADTDGDGMPDGAEFLAGTDPRNPASNGVDNDSAREYTYSTEQNEAALSVVGSWLVYETEFAEYPISFTNRPGVVGEVYELVLPAGIPSANISFDLEKIDGFKDSGDTAYSVYSYTAEDGTFKRQTGQRNGNVISAVVGSGVYFLAADGVLSDTAGLNIMFVIDNSGSMYPQELVTGSEENDIEFRRLDFAEHLIERIGDDVNFGVAKFTLMYTTLCPISDDDNAALSALEGIRNGSENFDGTEISNSIISAVNTFENHKSDHNYIIVITDGLPTNADGDAETRATEYAKDNNVSVITIGLGKKIDSKFLSKIAEETGGVYYQAVNNGTFDSISEKVETLLHSGRTEYVPVTEITENETDTPADSGELGVIVLADSGFVVTEDTLSADDIPTTYDRYGSDLGMAIFASLYYSGTLPQKADSYVTNSNAPISGYDLSGSEFYTLGKQNLSELELPNTKAYEAYKKLKSRWNFNNIIGGVLPLSNASLSALKPLDGRYKVLTVGYDWGGGRNIPGFLRTITFQPRFIFNSYEYPALDIESFDP
ncbi:MAG: VWA domain-containing protein, partial [Ruminococcus sp.]|nr:VWA domain-containing protein [Ruminococcus sp.]